MGNCFSCFQSKSTATRPRGRLDDRDNLDDVPDKRIRGQDSNDINSPVMTLNNGAQSSSVVEPVGSDNIGSLRSFRFPSSLSKTNMRLNNFAYKNFQSRIQKLFETYKDASEDLILIDGIEKLCGDLQMSPEEFRILILAWKCDAQQMCRFTRSEFTNGCNALQVDSVSSMKNKLTDVVNDLNNNIEEFKSLYRFTFRFGLDYGAGQRILPVDTAIALWKLIFNVREPAILQRWLNFLESKNNIRGIPKDTWNMFLNFAESVHNGDLSNYDDTEAWPSVFDDFVEYENDQANQNISDKGTVNKNGSVL